MYAKFPVDDVTHKPKRSQSANLLKANEYSNEEVVTISVSPERPGKFTLESAIKYYETTIPESTSLAVLYKQTAEWLRIYRINEHKIKVLNRGEAETSENHST